MKDPTRKFNLRTPVGKKNQIEQSNERQTAKQTSFIYYSGSRAIFYSDKNLFELVKRKEGFETKLQALESPDSDNRAKSYTKTKIGSGIAIRKIADLIREKEKRRTFARTNERVNAR